MSVEFIQYHGVRILEVDFSNCESIDGQLALLEQYKQMSLTEPDGSLRSLVDFSNQKVSAEFTELAKEVTKQTAHKDYKVAVVGISQLQRIILNTLNRISKEQMKPFATRVEALNYVASD